MGIYKKFKNSIKNNISEGFLDKLKVVRECLLFFPNYIVDIIRYLRFSVTALDYGNKEQLRAMLTKNFHIIEKGLSLPNTRPGFGIKVIDKTIFQMEKYISLYGKDSLIGQVIDALNEYVNFNVEKGVDVEKVKSAINRVNFQEQGSYDRGGIKIISKSDVLQKLSGSFEDICNSRHSIRIFSEIPVDKKLIRQAAEISRKTPSVCNRQSAKIYIFEGDLKNQILELQNGNRGFGNTASHVAVITSNLQCFTGVGERNQAYVDGGLMAMTFTYALHSLGIGTCFLNWSVTVDMDKKIKRIAGISNAEIIVTLIAIGNFPEKIRVAASPRLGLSDIFYYSESKHDEWDKS